MDELVIIIMGVFIANYNAEAHPYLTSCIKAFLIALLGFLWLIGKDFMNEALTSERIGFLLIGALFLWGALSLVFILLELIFSNRK